MFCEKCGSQITEGATFCERCGNQINHEHSTYKKNRKSKPKIIAIIAICVVIVATAIAVPVSISSCKKDTSLEGMLTAHKWVHGTIGKGYSEVYCFNKNGTYEAHSTEYDGQVRHEEMRKGSWNISEDNTLSVKTDDSIATGEWVWDYNINDENLHSHHFSSNTWYVSDNYLLLGKEWLYTPMN